MKRWLVFVFLLLSFPALAVKPEEQLKDPALESRARALSAELRCLVCQNQSIDDSDASLAQDLRKLVRERLVAGESDAQVRAFLVARYGDFVLLKPPVNVQTSLLWGLPVLALIAGGFAAFRLFRRKAELSTAAPLSADEQAKLDALLKRE